MQNQPYMTEEAKAVFNELSASPATAGEIAQNTHLSREKCQLILTQLVMAGLSVWMLQTPPLKGAFCCGNGRLVGVVAPNQPLAHAFRSQANQGPLL